jgi:hypothetical protein
LGAFSERADEQRQVRGLQAHEVIDFLDRCVETGLKVNLIIAHHMCGEVKRNNNKQIKTFGKKRSFKASEDQNFTELNLLLSTMKFTCRLKISTIWLCFGGECTARYCWLLRGKSSFFEHPQGERRTTSVAEAAVE